MAERAARSSGRPRKTLYQEFHADKPGDFGIGYLYVDSSNEMMPVDDPSWKTLGTWVQLAKASQLLITDANLTVRLENLDSYPGLKPWLGSLHEWCDILNSIIGATLGGSGIAVWRCSARSWPRWRP